MGVTIEDLKPKNFKMKIAIKDSEEKLEIECKPLRLSHTLTIAKVGNVLQNPDGSTKQKIKEAEQDMDEVISELIPELTGISLDIRTTISIIEQMLETVEPADNKEIREKGVKFDTDPKAPKIG